MTNNQPTATETEIAILNVLWDRESATVREIAESLYEVNTASAHATVKSLLDRLMEKGYVECDRSGFAHVFCASLNRSSFVGIQVQQMADSHFGGSLVPMLLTLVDRVKLSRRDRDVLRKIIENAK